MRALDTGHCPFAAPLLGLVGQDRSPFTPWSQREAIGSLVTNTRCRIGTGTAPFMPLTTECRWRSRLEAVFAWTEMEGQAGEHDTYGTRSQQDGR